MNHYKSPVLRLREGKEILGGINSGVGLATHPHDAL